MLHTTGRETQVYIYNMDNMALGIYSSKSRNNKSMSTRRGGKMERERERSAPMGQGGVFTAVEYGVL